MCKTCLTVRINLHNDETGAASSQQTWYLSKKLHRRIFRSKILHSWFHQISTVLVIKMSENGEIYTAGKKITLPLAVTAVTNLTSGSQGPRGGSLGPRATLFSGLFRLFVATSRKMCLLMSFSCAERNKTWTLLASWLKHQGPMYVVGMLNDNLCRWICS